MRPNRYAARPVLLVLACLLAAGPARPQDPGSLARRPLPPPADPSDPATPAKELFGRSPQPASLQARALGFYSRGCLAGGEALPVNGGSWQVMRLSRNRNWGHPALVAFLERFAAGVPRVTGWPGLLVGDMAQPRGGPMMTGHASHQVGLDADIWLTPMPDRRLSAAERERMSATSLVRPDRLDVDPATYTAAHLALIRAASREREVERIFVNPAIKRALCRDAGPERGWLAKVRPMWGHDYHFHVRLACPAGEGACESQDPPPGAEGCGRELDAWFTPEMLNPKPGKPRPPLTMAALPPECREVLVAP